MKDASDHLFQYSLVAQRIEQDSTVIWKNPTPNSASCTRPIYPLRAAKDDEAVLNLVISATDTAREQLQNPIDTVTHTIHDTMKDLKYKKSCQALIYTNS